MLWHTKNNGRCWAGIEGWRRGRSWSFAACVHEQGQGWISSLPLLLPSASIPHLLWQPWVGKIEG